CFESLSDLPGATKPFCQLAEEPGKAMEAGLGRLRKSGAQKPQPAVEIAVPDQQCSVEAMAPSSPHGQRMRRGAVEQHRHIAFGCRQIAGEQRYGAGSFAQCQTQGNVMIESSGVVDSALRGAPGLVG